MANYWQKRTYAELSLDEGSLAHRGLVFLMAQFFDVGSSASVFFALETNSTDVMFEFYDITSVDLPVEARLLEAPTYTKFGAAIPGRNLNRNYADNSAIGLYSASAVSGGTSIASELVGSGTKAGGSLSSLKVHTLSASLNYVMSFYNPGNQSTRCHINLGWSENEPERYRLVRQIQNTSGTT